MVDEEVPQIPDHQFTSNTEAATNSGENLQLKLFMLTWVLG